MNAPDLRKLAGGLARALGLSDAEVQRLETCPEHSLAVVMLRVAMGAALKRGLLKPGDDDRLIQRATPAVDPLTIMDSVQQTETKKMTTVTVEQVVRGIDAALASPATRGRFPAWFINDFWPGVLRRMASGTAMSEREQAIARSQLAEVSS